MTPSFLIADDSPHKVELMRWMLNRAGWNGFVLVAHTTEDAKKHIDAADIGFAFVDYYIPTENGPALIAYARTKHPHARIALVSSSDKKSNFNEAKRAGAEVCICTTYPPDDVERRFSTLLDDWFGREKEA